jgi:hypothetical protein
MQTRPAIFHQLPPPFTLLLMGAFLSFPAHAQTLAPPVGQSVVLDKRVTVPANDSNGYPIGPVQNGDTITLQYVSGLWKEHGGIATENPDEKVPGYGGAESLVIANGARDGLPGAIIKIVPGETAATPFSFVFPAGHDAVVLRIHSNSERKQNPGSVVYDLKITSTAPRPTPQPSGSDSARTARTPSSDNSNPSSLQSSAISPDEQIFSLTEPRTDFPIVLKNRHITTKAAFQPPVEIIVVAMASGADIRLAYAADQLIFNWGKNPADLRVDGGPANKHHKEGAGRIPPNQFATIKWVVTPTDQSVYVDGELRFQHQGNYSAINRPVGVASLPWKDNEIRTLLSSEQTVQRSAAIKSIKVRSLAMGQLAQILTSPPAPSLSPPAPGNTAPTTGGLVLDVLSKQALNASEWVVAPLEQAIPNDIRKYLTSLREDLLDEGKAQPEQNREPYKLGYQLCDRMIAALDEREQTLVRAGNRTVQATTITPATNQALEARRNYQMSWPQYFRESEQRADVKRVAEGNDIKNVQIATERLKLEWSERTAKLRATLDALYRQYRQALRQATK